MPDRRKVESGILLQSTDIDIIENTHVLYTQKWKIMILMKKYEDSKVPITIDPVTNEYKIIVPEWVVNEFDWYEDTELVWHVDDTGIHIQEVSE